jgi:hypothetical protein
MREDLLGRVFKKPSNLGPLLAIEIHVLSRSLKPALDSCPVGLEGAVVLGCRGGRHNPECTQKGNQDCTRCKEDGQRARIDAPGHSSGFEYWVKLGQTSLYNSLTSPRVPKCFRSRSMGNADAVKAGHKKTR